jgi:hypothetical protein
VCFADLGKLNLVKFGDCDLVLGSRQFLLLSHPGDTNLLEG